jgi:hypothetical protein
MNSNLMGSTSYGVALQKRWVCSFIIPNLLENGFTILEIYLLFLLIIRFNFLYLLILFYLNLAVLEFLLLHLSGNSIHSVFMRNTFNISRKLFIFPTKVAIDSCIIHLLHSLLATFLMKNSHILFILGK